MLPRLMVPHFLELFGRSSRLLEVLVQSRACFRYLGSMLVLFVDIPEGLCSQGEGIDRFPWSLNANGNVTDKEI